LDKHFFCKADRILKRSDFTYLRDKGKVIHARGFILVFSRGRCHRTRLGITVTKKVGNAVVRNRIKRLVREYFRLKRHKITGLWDINVIAKNGAANFTSHEAFSSMRSLFDKISAGC